ncbi:MAG: hypothetical protein IJ153_07595 [Clostridia bacterium]|nr:hypothetical protein [Clostridia bacterium]
MNRKAGKGYPRWKRIVLMMLAALVLLRIGYIFFHDEIGKREYSLSQYDLSDATVLPCQNLSQTFWATQNRLSSLELILWGEPEGDPGAVNVTLSRGEAVIYQAKISNVSINNGAWKKLFVNAPLIPGEEYCITLNASEDSLAMPHAVIAQAGASPEVIASYIGDQPLEGHIALNYFYQDDGDSLDKMVVAALWVLLYLMTWWLIHHVEKIIAAVARGKQRWTAHPEGGILAYLFELLGALLIISVSGVPFQKMTEILLYAISIAAMIDRQAKQTFVQRMTDRPWKKVTLILLYFYAAFALVGQRIWVYPLNAKLTAEKVFVYLATVLWFVPVINSLFFYLAKFTEKAFQPRKRYSTWQFIALSVCFLLLSAALNLFANNPGISSTDTYVTMLEYAHQPYGNSNWHPAFYVLVLRAILKIWDATYAVIFFQYFFWTYVVCELLLYLRQKGLSDGLLLGLALLCGVNAGNFVQLNTIWKDIPYTLSLLWAFTILAKLGIDFDAYKRKWYIYLEFIAALVGIYFYRHNGIVPFLFIVASVFLFLRKSWKGVAAVILSIAMVALIQGPVYHHFDVKGTGNGGLYHGLGQDILGVYYAGGEVSEETLQMIIEMTEGDNAEYDYNPTWSNQSYVVDVAPSRFILLYMDAFVKNPVLMTRAILDREDALWDIYQGQDTKLGCVNYTDTLDGIGAWNDYYPAHEERSISPAIREATAYTATAQWLNAIEWRSGLLLLLSLVMILFLLYSVGKGKHLLMLLPLIGQILSLLLSTGWADFRYFWPVNLFGFFLLPLVAVIVQRKGNIEKLKEKEDGEKR